MTATARRLLSLLFLFALVASACSGGDDDDTDEPDQADQGDGADGDDGSGDDDAEGEGFSEDDEAAIEAAERWIADESGLDESTRQSLQVVAVEDAGVISHVRFDQVYDDHRVVGASLTVHVLEDGSVQGANDELSAGTPPESMQMTLTEEEAVADAEKVIEGTIESSEAEAIWIQNGMDLLAAWQITIHTTDPVADWEITIDALSGDVLSSDREGAERSHNAGRLTTRTTSSAAAPKLAQGGDDACELPEAPSACIFLVDPIYSSGDPGITADEANNFLTGVELVGLDDPDDGVLVGEFADLNEDLNPTSARQDDARWGAGRGERGFEAQNTYYWIDYGQRTVQRLGFDDNLNRSFPVVALDPTTLDNAFYSPAEQQIYMGAGTTGGGINEGEDASGVLHEYGHALLDDINPGLLGGETGAYHEGFGDIFAYLTTLEFRTGDAECFFIWTDQECLRRMDSDRVYPDDLIQQVHTDGMIYTGAIYDVLAALLEQEGLDIDECPGSDDCNEVRDRVLTTVLQSNYFIGANDSLPDIAAHYVTANEVVYGDADRELIESAFAEHGLVGGSSGGAGGSDDGEVLVELDIVHTYRGDLRVTIGVVDADGFDLCQPLEVFSPDEEDSEHDLSGTIDLTDTDCAQFAPPSPDQTWYVFVEDTLAEDDGELVGFTVRAGGVPYVALGLPVPIIDADPTGTTAFVGLDGDSSGGGTMGGTIDPTQPFVSVAITHDYHGDLQIRAGVAAADDTIVCSVVVLDPDLSNDTSGELSGDIDMTECASFYPPSPDQRWFLTVADTAAVDEGTVDVFTLTGPDATVYDFDFGGSPAAIPDDDVDGIALLLDGSTATQGQAGGSGQGSDVELPAVSVEITHPYAGDMLVTAGVLDTQGRTLCEAVLFSPDSENDSDDLSGNVSLANDCGAFYPPSVDQQWFLFVADTLEVDEGTVDAFTLTGPDGIVYSSPDVGVAIPDADSEGLVFILDGDEAGAGVTVPTVSLLISHPYVGDLEAYVGVVDAAGEILCEVQFSEPDITVRGIDLALDVELPECAAFYPPGPGQQWYISAWDHFAADTGSIEAFVLFGPDGSIYDHPGVPLAIPDADPVGGAGLVFDGSQLPIVVDSGGSGMIGQDGGYLARIFIGHPYSGDLDVYVGVADDDFNSICEIKLVESDSSFAEADVFGDFSVADCEEFLPPGPGQQWYLLAIDTLERDEGTIDVFELVAPDGTVFESTDVPVPIPDADFDGAFALISG